MHIKSYKPYSYEVISGLFNSKTVIKEDEDIIMTLKKVPEQTVQEMVKNLNGAFFFGASQKVKLNSGLLIEVDEQPKDDTPEEK